MTSRATQCVEDFAERGISKQAAALMNGAKSPALEESQVRG